jgi:hypothetical protein
MSAARRSAGGDGVRWISGLSAARKENGAMELARTGRHGTIFGGSKLATVKVVLAHHVFHCGSVLLPATADTSALRPCNSGNIGCLS